MQTPIQFRPDETLAFETVTADLSRFSVLLGAHPNAQFELDLSHVKRCDSAGLAFLVEVKRLCGVQGANIVFQGIPEVIEALAIFCGIKDLLWGEELTNG